MTNTIIDLKQLKKELAENPPVIQMSKPPRPSRNYVRKTIMADTKMHLKIQNEETTSKKQEKTVEVEKDAIFPGKSENDFLLSLSEKGVKVVEETFNSPLLMSWSAPEYNQPENSYERMVLAGIIAAGFFTGSLIIKNYLLAIIVVLTYVILYVYSVRRPLMINFALTSRGIKIGSRLYEFEDLKSFWIFYDPPHQKELSIESKKVIMPYLKIPILDVKPAELRRQLINYLPEKKHEESLTDILARRLGY